MESLLIGRHNELKRFEEYMHSKKAEFVMEMRQAQGR